MLAIRTGENPDLHQLFPVRSQFCATNGHFLRNAARTGQERCAYIGSISEVERRDEAGLLNKLHAPRAHRYRTELASNGHGARTRLPTGASAISNHERPIVVHGPSAVCESNWPRISGHATRHLDAANLFKQSGGRARSVASTLGARNRIGPDLMDSRASGATQDSIRDGVCRQPCISGSYFPATASWRRCFARQ